MIDRNEAYVILSFACADDIRGLNEKPEKPYLFEVAAVKIEKRKIVSHFSSFIAIGGYDAHDICIDTPNIEAYGVMEEHLIGAPPFEVVAKRVCAYAAGCVPVIIPNFFDTMKIFLEGAKKYGLSFDRSVRQFRKTFPIQRKFKDGTSTTEIFSEYEIFLLDKDIMMNTREDLLTWTLSYARLALALMNEEEIFGGKNFPCEKYVLLDVETSGLNEERDRVISVSADKIIDGKLSERFFSFVAFPGELPREVVGLTGIRDEMLKGKPDLDTVMERFTQFRGALPIYADNAPFVRKFLKKYGLDIFEKNYEGS